MKKIKRSKKINPLTVGYVRTSIDKQIIMNQKLEILEYCRIYQFNIDRWIEWEISPNKSLDQARVTELLGLSKNEILIASEISKLGRSASDTIGLVNQILRNGVRVIFTKQNLDLNPIIQDSPITRMILTIFSTLAELERNIISLRTREALSTKKKRGFNIGKIKGTVQSSIYDAKKEQILLLLSKKVSIFDISKIIGIGKARSLMIYLNKRKLKEGKITKE